MNYLVQDGVRGKVFATLTEANAYRNEHFRRTGDIVAVVETNRKVTHKMEV